MSVVYFVRIGKHIKIGHTINIDRRMRAFRNAAVWPELLFTIPGDRKLEKRLHTLLEEHRAERELFNPDHRISSFIAGYQNIGPEWAWNYLEKTLPRNLELEAFEHRRKARERMLAERREKRARIDALCSTVVEQRKALKGW